MHTSPPGSEEQQKQKQQRRRRQHNQQGPLLVSFVPFVAALPPPSAESAPDVPRDPPELLERLGRKQGLRGPSGCCSCWPLRIGGPIRTAGPSLEQSSLPASLIAPPPPPLPPPPPPLALALALALALHPPPPGAGSQHLGDEAATTATVPGRSPAARLAHIQYEYSYEQLAHVTYVRRTVRSRQIELDSGA